MTDQNYTKNTLSLLQTIELKISPLNDTMKYNNVECATMILNRDPCGIWIQYNITGRRHKKEEKKHVGVPR